MIQLQTLHKRFGTFTAVDGVSLDVAAGEFLTLLGPSGCGKTTLLRMISGFERPDSGTILLDGRDVTADPPYRRNVNQVFQSYALFPHLSVEQNIAYGLKVRGLPRHEIREKTGHLIDLVSLDGLARRMPNQLSGGQKQRVALARALVCEPKVLLLDEPLAALDAKLRRSMQLELKKLQGRLGITFVFVTHDQDEAMTMSDRIAVMNAGKIVQLGPAAEVYDRPRTAFVASFLGQTNLLEGKIISRGVPATVSLSDGSIVEAKLPADQTGDDVLLSIRPERIVVASDGIAVQIADRVFKGATEQLTLRTAGGLMLSMTVPAGTATVTAVWLPAEHLAALAVDQESG
jgi:spermidine/putrescine transport system ATP-binding protein